MSVYVSGAQLTGRRGRRSPLPFLKIEKLDLLEGEKWLDCVHPWIKCSCMLSFKILF